VLVLIAASPLAQAQSSAVLKWAEVDKPSITGEIIVVPSEVNRIAASHMMWSMPWIPPTAGFTGRIMAG
jgi:hypothetical protein